MSTSVTGYSRNSADNVAKRHVGRHITSIHPSPNLTQVAVAYSAAGTNAKYLDMYYGTQVVTGGYAKFFTGIGVGILTQDTGDGDVGQFDLEARGWVELTVGETPAVNTPLYWDAGTSLITGTASTNQRIGFVAPLGIGEAVYQVVTTATERSLPVGTWVHIQLQPIA